MFSYKQEYNRWSSFAQKFLDDNKLEMFPSVAGGLNEHNVLAVLEGQLNDLTDGRRISFPMTLEAVEAVSKLTGLDQALSKELVATAMGAKSWRNLLDTNNLHDQE